MLELPEFDLLKRQPRAAHVAHTVIKRDWPNEYGTPITYEVEQSRNKKDWWIHASHAGYRSSNTLHTSVPSKAETWIKAVESGKICVGCVSKKSPAELYREIQETLAKREAHRYERRKKGESL